MEVVVRAKGTMGVAVILIAPALFWAVVEGGNHIGGSEGNGGDSGCEDGLMNGRSDGGCLCSSNCIVLGLNGFCRIVD